jgi:Arc/MetJ family transcription regulator
VHRGVDHDRVAEARAAVDDAVRDGLGVPAVRERLDRPRLAAVDEVELDARRAGVDD